ncbi:hypothetical protein OK349_05965 [Sphingomonas sp. BT-65]|uniref:hypothetical protein n=1 Tax=Sphingomonas sp. BT-65 TaxID=2989821 RepID=UPI0022356081|nr:hypothetical protein [Sphingomonas sp. BT-65]MCW4461245.1 hypothetical protein [Sphingomonas sp. BT-65]
MRTFLLAGLSLALAAPAAVPLTASPAVPASQCRAGEKTVYSCRFGKSLGSVCAGRGSLHYRFGPPGRPQIEIASDANWGNVHRGGVVGGGGGSQEYLRFTRGDHHYLVFWGVGGQYTEIPGKQWSGIHVSRGGNDLATLRCKSNAWPTENWEQLLRASLPGHLREVPDDTDPQFEAWY